MPGPTTRPAGNPDDEFLLVLIGGFAALAAGPSLLTAAGVNVSTWLVSHHVLVAHRQATLSLPLLEAGLDIRRLVIAALLLLTLCGTALALRRRRPKRTTS